MKSSFRTLFVAALVAIASAAPTLRAQEIHARVRVPFAFDYGSRHFAPGLYTLDNTGSSVLRLRHEATAAMLMFRSDFDLEPAKTSCVIFRKYGDRYFIEEVWVAGKTEHLALNESHWEKQAARQVGRRQTAPTAQVALLDAPAN